MMKMRMTWALAVLLLGACAGHGGRGLAIGASTANDAEHLMGPPALEWADPDGSRQLAYPRGPMGVHTYMLHFGPDGRLASMGNVLEPATFARVLPGMGKEEVLRLLGPSRPDWTVYYERRDELALEWRFCDDWNQLARFAVLFDASSGIVRSTLIQREDQVRLFSETGGLWCAR